LQGFIQCRGELHTQLLPKRKRERKKELGERGVVAEKGAYILGFAVQVISTRPKLRFPHVMLTNT
jgi:hypothetical protein